jgi:hypothetical protein
MKYQLGLPAVLGSSLYQLGLPAVLGSSFNCARMGIASVVVRATHLCIRGSPIPTRKMSNRLPQWEDKVGFGLFRR